MTTTDSALKLAVARDFGMAAGTYDRFAGLQCAVGEALMSWLPDCDARTVADVGCGTGFFLMGLRHIYPQSQLFALDLAEPMVRHARDHRPVNAAWLAGDAEALPLAGASLDLVFSSLALQWCPSLEQVLREIERVLRPGGSCVFSTLLDGTLRELDQAWQTADPGQSHVNRFLTAAEVRRSTIKVFGDVELETQSRVQEYADPLDLLRELKGLGARHKADARRRSLTGTARVRAFRSAYERFRLASGAWPATYEVAYVRVQKTDGHR